MVTGHFDPVTAEHVRRLAELKRPGCRMVVVITSPPDPILPARARAELVAALADVDEVIGAGAVVCEEAADLERTRVLVDHVRARH